jgi:hypothetical protein
MEHQTPPQPPSAPHHPANQPVQRAPNFAPTPPKQEDPDKSLAIVSLALWIVLPFPPIMLVLSLIAQSQSKKRGYINTLAKVNVIISGIATALLVLFLVFMLFLGLLGALSEA